MSDDSRAIVPIGKHGVVASVSRQLAITEKLLTKLRTGRALSSEMFRPELVVQAAKSIEPLAISPNGDQGKADHNPKLHSFPACFDEETYQKAKPHFEAAAKAFQKAGMSFREFIKVFFKAIISQFGEGVKPYAIQFAREYEAVYKRSAMNEQLHQVRLWPASREAVRMLKLVKAPRAPGLPALLQLLQWAVEDAAPEMKLDLGKAPIILEELLYLSMMNPLGAVMVLLNVDDPTSETPSELDATTPRDAALSLISLANQAVAK